MGNMYSDAKSGVANVFVGCHFQCLYCEKSFQRQMKRQKNNCMKCYNYEPHFHPERLKQSLPRTTGDEFIWLIRSGDPYFMKKEDLQKVLDLMQLKTKRINNREKTFFLQSKNPECFWGLKLPPNLIIGTTIETNRKDLCASVSKAPTPQERFFSLLCVNHPRKFLTLEPLMDFKINVMIRLVKEIKPERVYIGYDTKNSRLVEPSLQKTTYLIEALELFTKVKTKLLRNKKGDD